jgi:hypothetical protein
MYMHLNGLCYETNIFMKDSNQYFVNERRRFSPFAIKFEVFARFFENT